MPKRAPQNSDGVLQNALEHGTKLARRARDDPEHLGGRGLLFQCFAELASARLLSLEQAHVFDCDHRLVGEGLEQLNVLIGERRDPVSGDYDCSYGGTIL